jgi:hypothetical protein
MQRRSDKHGPLQDEELEHEVPGGVRYRSVQELSEALGLSVERERT